jgi:hypothetical protein
LALLFGLGPAILLLGKQGARPHGSFFVLAGMLLALAVRLAWLGTVIGAVTGFALLVACSVTLDGRLPHVVTLLVDAATSVFAGFRGLLIYLNAVASVGPRAGWRFWVSVVFPAAATLVFGTLFVLANPDLVERVTLAIDRTIQTLVRWIRNWTEHLSEILFWLVAAYFTIALLRPLGQRLFEMAFPPISTSAHASDETGKSGRPSRPAVLYWAMHNTLLAVIALFAIYLAYEFIIVWFRHFPPGFSLSRHARQGAAWLTVALALSTLVLSLVFRGGLLDDPRISRLRRLAWIWSVENFLLAVTVYHRMQIYVDGNGMSRMRTVGLFGISTVVMGFSLVLWKILHKRDFTWLIRGQLGTLALAVYLFALTPVDALIHTYNVRRILDGDPAPTVQMTANPVNNEGVLFLQPLAHSRDVVIREGVRAMLAERAVQLRIDDPLAPARHWTRWQGADAALAKELARVRADWEPYRDPARRMQALKEFHRYAYQWN